MIIDDGSLVVMAHFHELRKIGRYMLSSWQPTLGFYSVRGPDFHTPPEAK